jgi:hypothetical protein
VRSQDCRTTLSSAQALLFLVFAACGQERVSDPFTPSTREAGDTIGVLRAVTITEMNARAQAARSDSDFPANCRRRGLPCWRIETTDWYISTNDRTAIVLADLLGVRAARQSPPVPPPACPWPSTAPGAGYHVALSVRFTGPSLAEAALSRSCDNPPGYLHDIFRSWETFEVRRVESGWKAEIASVGVT